jgi:hypothetical protein
MANTEYRVEEFGRDCLGNITGYRVVTGYGPTKVTAKRYCGDIYTPGTFEGARDLADFQCDLLNIAENP